MEDKEIIAEELKEKPIWVQDLVAWLKKIQQQNLTGEKWVERMQEWLAELPSPNRDDYSYVTEDVQDPQYTEIEPQPLSDEERQRFQQQLKDDESHGARAKALAVVAPKHPPDERKALLKKARDTAQNIAHDRSRLNAIVAITDKLPLDLLKQALSCATF